MKHNYESILAVILLTVTSATASAESMQKPGSMPMKGTGMHHGMGRMMAGMTEEQKDQHLRGMQEHMLKMHDLSNQILAEKDAAKKEQLMTQQRQLMKEHHTQMMEQHKDMMEMPKK